MVKKIVLFLGLVGSVFALVGCRINDPEDYTTPEYEWTSHLSSHNYQIYPARNTMESYNQMLDTEFIPESFIYYEDINFIGELVWYRGVPAKAVEDVHASQQYLLEDKNGMFYIYIYQPEVVLGPEWSAGERPEMPVRECFFCAPELTQERGVRSYCYRNINYNYEEGKLKSIWWQFGVYKIDIVPEGYPDVENDAFVSRLLHADTAVAAKNQLNRAIFWRQTRVFLKKAAPIAIPVICVLAVGIPTLVVYCRKKRRIRIQEEQGESDLA